MALINYTGKNVFGTMLGGGEIVRLLPGINEVDDNLLKQMKEHPLFQSRINLNLVQIMQENKDKDGKVSVQEMLKNIPQMFDIKLLKKIVETDGRDKVVHSAREQIDRIKNPSKVKEEESEHFG